MEDDECDDEQGDIDRLTKDQWSDVIWAFCCLTVMGTRINMGLVMVIKSHGLCNR